MPPASVADFVAVLRKCRLLEPEQLEEIQGHLQGRFATPLALAKGLLDRDWLTPYQVNQIFQDRADQLVLGQYVLLERLGEGGMGQVFKARHRSLGRVVALKVIRKERLNKPEVIRRFHKEVQAAAQLKHPNVVLAFDADEIDNTHFIAMEYVEGIDLARLVKKRGPLPIEQACDFISQAALGLQHAHERGLVHRDIKPANLFVTRLPGLGSTPAAGPTGKAPGFPGEQSGSTSGSVRGPQVKVLDMGLARLHPAMEDETTAGVTQEGVVVGTVDYLAPEQAMNSSNVDIRADIYSLGCTFYYLLTGKVPFGGASAMEKLLKHRDQEPMPVEQLRPEVSPSLGALLRKLMAKRPQDRYQTPAQVALALTNLVTLGGLAKDLSPAVGGQPLPRAILVSASGVTNRGSETRSPRTSDRQEQKSGGVTARMPAVKPAGMQETPGPWDAMTHSPPAKTSVVPGQPSRTGRRSWLVGLALLVLVLVLGALVAMIINRP